MNHSTLLFTTPLANPAAGLRTTSYRLSRSQSLRPPRHSLPFPSRKRTRTIVSSITPATTEAAITSAIASGSLAGLPSLVIRDIDSISYKSLVRCISCLVSNSSWRAAIRIFEAGIRHPDLRQKVGSRLCSEIFYCFMKINNRSYSRSAYKLYLRLDEEDETGRGIGPKAYNFLYVSLCRSGFIDEAIQVHESCVSRGFYLNRYSYNTFLNACAKTNRTADAFITLRSMAEANVPPDVVSCNVLIACCIRSDEMDVALTILDRMQDWGIAPDVYSYNSVINGFRKFGMLDEAFDLVARMEIGAGMTPIEGRRPPGSGLMANPVVPDLVTYNTLISAIAAHDDPEFSRAQLIHNHMKKNGNNGNEVTYNALMATAARANKRQDAFDIFDEMVAQNLQPNCECYTTLITMCGQAGQTFRAFQIHEKMIDSGVAPSVVTFNALLTACRRGDRERAADMALKVLDIMRQTPGCNPDVITYSTLIDTLGRDGRFTEVRTILDEMTSSGVQPNLVTYTSMISALSRVGDHEGAMKVVQDMEESGIEPNVYTFSCLVNAAGRRGELERSLSILKMMRERDIWPSGVTYIMLIQMSVRNSKRDSLQMLLAEMGEDSRFVGTTVLERLGRILGSEDVFNNATNGPQLERVIDIVSEVLPTGDKSRLATPATSFNV